MKNMNILYRLGLVFIATSSIFQSVKAQNINGGDVNTITTAVPFLTIAPDARHAAMGDAGVATSPDNASIHWNPAKLAWVDQEAGVAINYTPWLRNLVPDISLSYLSGYYRLNDMSAISASLRYFSLGDIQFTDEFGNNTIQHRPNEWALDGAYSRKLSDRFSAGLALRFVYSNLTGGQDVQNAQTKPGLAVAADISAYYQNDDIEIGGKEATLAFGGMISNIGNKMSYSNLDEEDFLPMNFRVGPRITLHLDDYNDLSFHFDVNKLLVPTPPVYNADGEIMAGEDPNRAVANAIFTSWTDAPGFVQYDEQGNPLLNDDGTYQVEDGSVLKEELREFYFGFGAEYWYNKVFAARMGYFTEHASKGNRKYLTFGLGLKYNVFGIDLAYLAPFYVGNQRSIQNSPLQNTLRFSLSFDFDALGSGNDEEGIDDPLTN
jgi:hypothetical protein